MINISGFYKTGRLFFIVCFSLIPSLSFPQENGKVKNPYNFGGAISLTNNGISLIPNLTLGKPAVVFDMNVGRRLTFEPQFRFALEGKPWSFILWWRYKIYEGEKFRLNIGAHPAFAFRNNTFEVDNTSRDYITVNRYLAGEIYPSYSISENINTGIYFLQAYCLEKYSVKNTTMLALRLNFTGIQLTEQFYMRFYPQVYYLKMDDNDGFYYTSAITFAKRGFPLSVSSVISTPFKTTIPQNKDFIWNVSLTYSFNKQYVEK